MTRSASYILLLGVAGIGCLFGGVARFANNQTFLSTAVIAEGPVSGEPAARGRVNVSIRLPDGAEATISLRSRFRYDPGERVRIAYQPDNPDLARILSFWEMNLGSTVLFTLGILLAGTAVVAAFVLLATRPPSEVLSVFDIPGALLGDDEGPELMSEPIHSDHVSVQTEECYEISDPVTGETRTYHSMDEIPPEIRKEIADFQDRFANDPGSSQQEGTYTYTDSFGTERTYQSLDEMPPEIRRFFEGVADQWEEDA